MSSLQAAFNMETNALFICYVESKDGAKLNLIFQWHGYMSYGVIQQTDNGHYLSLQLTLIFFSCIFRYGEDIVYDGR